MRSSTSTSAGLVAVSGAMVFLQTGEAPFLFFYSSPASIHVFSQKDSAFVQLVLPSLTDATIHVSFVSKRPVPRALAGPSSRLITPASCLCFVLFCA